MRMHEPTSVRDSTSTTRKTPHLSSLRSFTFLPCSGHQILAENLGSFEDSFGLSEPRVRGRLDVPSSFHVVAHSTPHALVCSVDRSHIYTMSIRLFPSFPCLHARHLTQSPCTYFSVSSILQIRVSLLDKVLFFRAKTLFTRGTCCIQLGRHVIHAGMAWLMEQVP
jgi:hypothetical protein